MRARIIGLATAAALAAPVLAGQAPTASAATAQFYVTGYVLLGYTATGTYVHPGTCAVDPRIIPLGSYFTISGIGVCHAEDTGGAIIGYRIDVWVPTVAQADALTGWYTVTWGVAPSQQVLGYHAAQSPTPTPVRPTPTPVAPKPPTQTPTPPPPKPPAQPARPAPAHSAAPPQPPAHQEPPAPAPLPAAPPQPPSSRPVPAPQPPVDNPPPLPPSQSGSPLLGRRGHTFISIRGKGCHAATVTTYSAGRIDYTRVTTCR